MPSDFLSLSTRAVENLSRDVGWRSLSEELNTPYHKDKNADGIINMGVAESSLMHQELAQHVKLNFEIDPIAHLTYGQGPNGSPRLIRALSQFMNDRFHPVLPVTEGQLMISSGIAAVIDSLTWAICDEGEGILISAPLYAGFLADIELRSGGRLLPVSYRRENEDYNALDVLDANLTRVALETALEKYRGNGITARAVLISNPHNPLGRCYSVDTLREIAQFCGRRELHLISDEVYANSTFINPSFPNMDRFRSVLSIDLADVIDLKRLHVLYGMSKDFCANGMRLGALQTRNVDLHEAVASINQFSWPSYAAQDIWGRILGDKAFVENFTVINQRRMAHSYARFTSFLDQHNIPYVGGGNSGFFIWAHLIREPAVRSCAAAQKSVVTLKDELLKTCRNNGVLIRDGSKFFAEEPEDGWFRLTYTLDEQSFIVGTDRLLRSLKQIGLV